MRDATSRYLERYAEPESDILLPIGPLTSVLVIPAYQETADQIHQTTEAVSQPAEVLVVVVNNSNEENDPSSAQLEADLVKGQTVVELSKRVSLIAGHRCPILLVDCYTPGNTIEKNRGVGLARKLGCDMALSLINQGVVRSHWIHTTDADARLPRDHFERDRPDNSSACLAAFRHEPEQGLELSTLLYEIRLLYYAAAMKWAGSPYAYPAIGSIMTINAARYASVRGFPRRSTGEDFYLLNKLRKLGQISLLPGEPVVIAGRYSNRVPVGTGTALRAISDLDQPADDYQYEHPDCYLTLRAFIKEIRELALNPVADFRFANPLADDFAAQSKLYEQIHRKQTESASPTVMQKHLDDWFDGLRTRQFIHFLRDEKFGTVSAEQLTTAPFLSESMTSDLSGIRDQLFHCVYSC